MMDVAITVADAATDAREVAARLSTSLLPMTSFDREWLARILDRLSEELAEAATDVRRAR